MTERPPLRCLYDLRSNPVTFDFAIFLAMCESLRQSVNCPSINLSICNKAYRLASERDVKTPQAEKEWRVYSILLQCCSLLPSLSTVSLTNEEVESDFPIAGTRKPYLASELLGFWENGIDPRVLTAPQYAKEVMERRYRGEKYVTLTMRHSSTAPERNPDMGDWRAFQQWLTGQGYPVIVVPDTEALLNNGSLSSEYGLDRQAALDVRLRLALYENAVMNVGSSNGPIGMAFFSKAPVLQFDQFRGNKFSAKAWKDLNGFDPPGQFPWAAKNQRFAWKDSTFENLKSEFEKVMA